MATMMGFVLLGLSLGSTSSDLVEREKMLDDKHCASTYKRMLNFAKYFPPGSNSDYIMYNPDKVGFQGYDLLGDVYYRGCAKAGLAPDKVAAAAWYQSAAVVHLSGAQWKLGRMFYEGDGIPENKEAGLAWITSAAFEGSLDAARYLSDIGQSVPVPVSPNSYSVAAEQAKNRLEAAQAAERDRVVKDLGSLLVNVGAAYVAAQANVTKAATNLPASQPQRTPPTTALKPVMTRPVYCNSYASATPVGDTIYVRVNQFCY